MTTRILFVRHGAHDRLDRVLCGRMPGVVLSDTGLRQADAVASAVVGEGLAAVYASPLERTRQTAAALARAAGLEVEIDERLIEIDLGDWSGLPFEALRARDDWKAWNAARHRERAPGGETMAEASARALDFVDAVRRRHPDETVAAVTHADMIKALVLHVMGAGADRIHQFDIAPASITRLDAYERDLRLIRLNEVCA